MIRGSKQTSYTPKLEAKEAGGGDKWARIQAQLATSARKENQSRAQNSDNGWGPASNPFDMNSVLNASQSGAANQAIDLNAAMQANQNMTSSMMQQAQDMARQQSRDNTNNMLLMGQQRLAQEQGMRSFEAQLERSQGIGRNPSSAGEWMQQQNAMGQQQDAARVADERSRATMSAQIAAQQYQQAKDIEKSWLEGQMQLHQTARNNQTQKELANTQANAQIRTAQIGAEAGVLSSMFNSFGGGGGWRYW